jgi:hypothetical protein
VPSRIGTPTSLALDTVQDPRPPAGGQAGAGGAGGGPEQAVAHATAATSSARSRDGVGRGRATGRWIMALDRISAERSALIDEAPRVRAPSQPRCPAKPSGGRPAKPSGRRLPGSLGEPAGLPE